MTADERIVLALDIVARHGDACGDRVGCWVLDQVVRMLAGDEYSYWVRNYNNGIDAPRPYPWDEGVPP